MLTKRTDTRHILPLFTALAGFQTNVNQLYFALNLSFQMRAWLLPPWSIRSAAQTCQRVVTRHIYEEIYQTVVHFLFINSPHVYGWQWYCGGGMRERCGEWQIDCKLKWIASETWRKDTSCVLCVENILLQSSLTLFLEKHFSDLFRSQVRWKWASVLLLHTSGFNRLFSTDKRPLMSSFSSY